MQSFLDFPAENRAFETRNKVTDWCISVKKWRRGIYRDHSRENYVPEVRKKRGLLWGMLHSNKGSLTPIYRVHREIRYITALKILRYCLEIALKFE